MALPLHGEGDREAEVMVDINTTPLVDVLLVLLVMLIITIPIQLHSVTIDTPSANTPPPPVPPEIVQLQVAADGRYFWNGEALAGRAALDARLATAAAASPQPEIHLRPERGVRYDAVAAAMASAQRLGLTRIGLVGSEQFAR
jgi:biopolymer transport protein ExbD